LPCSSWVAADPQSFSSWAWSWASVGLHVFYWVWFEWVGGTVEELCVLVCTVLACRLGAASSSPS
jgi:hypothetical protein